VVASQLWQTHLYGLDKAVALAASLEPFVNDFFSPGSDSAYQPDRSQAVFHSIISSCGPMSESRSTTRWPLRCAVSQIRSAQLPSKMDRMCRMQRNIRITHLFLAHHWRTCIWKGLRGVQSRRSDGPSRELEILSFAYAAIPESWRIGYKGFRYSWTLTRVSRTIVRVSSLIRIMPCNNVYT
jgi:hypothetical protein